MRHALSIILLASTVLLAGCIHKISMEKLEQEIIAGKTTIKEVQDRFGAPYMKYRTPGLSIACGQKGQLLHKPGEAWLYHTNYLGALDFMEQETLRIQFDEKGIVSSFTITNVDRTAPME